MENLSQLSTKEQSARTEGPLLCPSAQPDWRGATVIGVVRGSVSEPKVAFLGRALPVVQGLLDMTAPVAPSEVFRFAAPCAFGKCQHFQEKRCHLVEKVVAILPPATGELPPCAIRSSCRWFAQEQSSACFRCPQIVTDAPPLDSRMLAITDPHI